MSGTQGKRWLEPHTDGFGPGLTVCQILIDVDASSLDACLDEVLRQVEARGNRSAASLAEIEHTLRQHADLGPETREHEVATVQARLWEPGPSVEVLLRTRAPLELPDEAGRGVSFVWVLLSNELVHPLASRAAEMVHLMADPEVRATLLRAQTPEELDLAYRTALGREIRFGAAIPEELVATGRLFGGIKADLARRLPLYASDFSDGLKPKVLASALFLFFACVAPAVAFGGLLSELTNGQIGVVESMLATAIAGATWALFSGQPLAIIGATGPNVVFTGILFSLCTRLDIPFLPTAAWVGLWTMVYMLVLAAVDASALIRFFTRFTDEVFAALISLIYIYEAVVQITAAFRGEEVSYATALLTLIIAVGTFWVALTLVRLRRQPYLRGWVREFLADFGPSIAIVVAAGAAYLIHDVHLAPLPVPDHLQPSTERSWLVNPLEAPVWVWLAAAVPAIFLTILVWVNQNITARLVNSPDLKLRKGAAYHYDIALMGVVLGVTSMFGLPWVVGAVVRSLNHARSLVIVDPSRDDGRVLGVIETRLSNLLVHLSIGASLFFLPALRNIPMAALFGIFLFMGVSSMMGNQFFERLSLWITDPSRLPPTYYLRVVPTPVVHRFTGIQLVCLAALWVVKVSAIGIAFPFFVALLVPLRMFVARFFEPHHLALLDAAELPEDEQYRETE